MSERVDKSAEETADMPSVSMCFACNTPQPDNAVQFCVRCGEPVFPPSLLTTGRFKPKKRLGQGGMGTVYLVEDSVLRTERALKVLNLPRDMLEAEQASLRLRLVQEAQASQWLCARSHHVVQVFDIGVTTTEQAPYIVMERLVGDTLSSRLNNAPLTIDTSLNLARQLCSALGHAHRRLMVHRDLKPDNLMLVTMDDRPNFLKILDFGLVKMQNSMIQTESGVTVGTLNYMAPEQLRGEDIAPSADVFSIGAILFECLTGVRANPGQTPTECMATLLDRGPRPIGDINASLPEPLRTLVDDCLHLDPELRPQDADEVGRRLAAIADDTYRQPEFGSEAENTPTPPNNPTRPDDLASAHTQDGPSSEEIKGHHIEPHPSTTRPTIILAMTLIVLCLGAVILSSKVKPGESAAVPAHTNQQKEGVVPAIGTAQDASSAGGLSAKDTDKFDGLNIHPVGQTPGPDQAQQQRLPDALPSAFTAVVKTMNRGIHIEGETIEDRLAALLAHLTFTGRKKQTPAQGWSALTESTRQWLYGELKEHLADHLTNPLVADETHLSSWKSLVPNSVVLPRLGRLFVDRKHTAVFEAVNCGLLASGDRMVTVESTIRGYPPERCTQGACVSRLASILRKARQNGERVRLKFKVQQAYHGTYDTQYVHSTCTLRP